MRIRDGAALWSDIKLYELDGKKLGEMSIHEVELLADLLSRHSEGDVAPHFDGEDLIIPFGPLPGARRPGRQAHKVHVSPRYRLRPRRGGHLRER